MKNIIIAGFLMFLCIESKAQDCFGEFDSMVSSVACINYEYGFELALYGAIASEIPQPSFAVNNDHGTRTRISSFYMIDKKGKLFNIHQYGFKIGDMIVDIDYKIISFNRLVELAIVIDGQPVFHKVSDLSENKGDDVRVITGIGIYGGKAERFALLLRNSDLVGFQMNKVDISIVE